MSYILEALRRAQADRDRGQVPRLDAQPLPAGSAAATRAGRPAPALWVGATIALLTLLAALAWLAWPQWHDRAGPRTVPAPPGAAAAVVPVPVPVPVPAAAPAPAPLPIVVSAPQAPGPTPAPAPVPAPAAPAQRPAPAAAATERLRLNQLSAQQRSALPALTVSGSVWSASPASRFVVVNGQVVREGQEAAPGVTVEHIGEQAMTVGWRGLHLELPF